MDVALYSSSGTAAHAHDWPSIERPERLSQIEDALRAASLVERCVSRDGRRATDEELRTVHSASHVAEVARLSQSAAEHPDDRELREPDGKGGVYYSAASDEAARLACGCVVDAALAVLPPAEPPTADADLPSSFLESSFRTKVEYEASLILPDDERAAAEMAAAAKHRTVAAAAGQSSPSAPPARAAFALVRPPGHHAGHDPTPGHQAEGFCFYNSVAVAAGVALASGRARRVAIVDWDVHHGNGTQTLLYDEPRVLYISLHRFGDRWYPYTGGADEVGAGAGVGYNLNVPWVEDALGDADYAAAFELVVEPALAAFAPDLVLVSAGFDAAEGDLQGKMRVTPAGFAEMTARLLRTRVPLALALEGGYNLEATAACAVAVVRALLGDAPPEAAAAPASRRLGRRTEATLREVMRAQAAHWPALSESRPEVAEFFAEAGARPKVAERASKRQRA